MNAAKFHGSHLPYDRSSGRRCRVRYHLPDHSQTDKRGFKTKRETDLLLANVEVAKSRREFVATNQSRITVAEWAGQWFATQVQLKPSTRNGYVSIVRSAITPNDARSRSLA